MTNKSRPRKPKASPQPLADSQSSPGGTAGAELHATSLPASVEPAPAPADAPIAAAEDPAAVAATAVAEVREPARAPSSRDAGGALAERLAAPLSDLILSKDSESEDRAPVVPFPVVGIGASGARLEALSELLRGLPGSSGMAFVLVLHVSPQHRSALLGLLQPLSKMLISEATDGMLVQPDCIYIAPASGLLTMRGGSLRIEPCRKDRQVAIIDHFFRSLAAEQRSGAIGILLTCDDTDGTLGLKAIKGEGGIAILESDAPTRFDGSGRTVLTQDHVDLLLHPAQIGEELSHIAKQLLRAFAELVDPVERLPDEQQTLSKIYALLRKATGVDFNLYKQTTLRRRIARRMVVQRITTLADYLRHLQSSPSEVKELYEDMLINVTRFFRDPDTFAALSSDILPLLMQDRQPEQPIRIWVPGCATGEEVYSLAIIVLEYLRSTSFDISPQIFGTDISERSIEKARSAVYPESAVSELSPERLRRFFTKVEGGYQVVKRVRDLCVFARQNLASDPPFSRLDLISCRNVLIYLGPTLQKAIMPTFHYALKPNGFLLLGSSETIRDYSNLFVLLDKRHKVYARNPSTTRTTLDLTTRAVPAELLEPPRHERLAKNEGWSEVELQRAADRIILARFGPAGVIINERAEILQTRGHTSPFLELPPGTATLSLLRMVKEHIAMDLRDGIQRAVADDIPVRLAGLHLLMDERHREIAIDILPIQSQGRKTRCFLVLFIPVPEQQSTVLAKRLVAEQQSASSDEKDKEILQLRNDLASTKLYLQSLLEERDIANQELISANEEIQSSNEELQSINEELETAKEELQSTNEELQTVNEELSNRNLELSQTSNDLINLLNNITIPVLMLGSDLRIRQFTPIAERMMNVRAADIGRPIGEIRLNLNIDDLEPMLYDVIETLSTKELEVQDRSGRWHLLRARPYRTADNKIEGVVLVLVEIDQIRRSQQQLMEARDFAQAVVDSAQVPLVVLTSDLRVKMANRGFYAISGLPSDEVEARSFPELVARQWGMDSLRQQLERLDRQVGSEFEIEHETSGNPSQVLLINARPLVVDNEHAILVAIHDISARRQAERLLTREKERLEGRVEVTRAALDRTQEELRALAASLFTAQEEERRRVSRELHDDLGQRVAVLELSTAQIEQKLRRRKDKDQEPVDLSGLRQQTAALAEDLRRIAFQLHPTILDDLGLCIALKALVDEFAHLEGMPASFTSKDVPSKLAPDISGSLYRITQEALRNIVKHAGKTQVKVDLKRIKQDLRLRIRDFGRGFDPSDVRGQGGMGILNMEERARLIGGKFHLKARRGEGAVITVQVPLRKEGT